MVCRWTGGHGDDAESVGACAGGAEASAVSRDAGAAGVGSVGERTAVPDRVATERVVQPFRLKSDRAGPDARGCP